MTEADRRPAERTRRGLAVAQPDWDDRNFNPKVLCHLRQPHQAASQLDRSIASLNLPLWEHHQLLAIGQQLDRQSQGRTGRSSWIHRKASEPMQEPTLKSLHFASRHHESTIPAADASSGCHREHQAIPAGSMGRSQKHRAPVRESLRVQHQPLTELEWKGDVLGDEHRKRCPELVNAHSQGVFTVCQGRTQQAF